jgi:hypothetical protein
VPFSHSQEWLCHDPSSPLAVPPTLPRIVIGRWDDEDEEFSEQK